MAIRNTKNTNKKKPSASYDHKDKKRANNLPVGLVNDPRGCGPLRPRARGGSIRGLLVEALRDG